MEKQPMQREERFGSDRRIAETRALLEQSHSALIIIPYSSRIYGMGHHNEPLVTIVPEKETPLRQNAEMTADDDSASHRRVIRPANVVLSSYSAFVTEAGRALKYMGAASHVVAVGETTFSQGPSTSELMRRQLKKDINTTRVNGSINTPLPALRAPIDEADITVVSGVQDTDQQIRRLRKLTAEKPEIMKKPLYIVMDFHKNRVKALLAHNGLVGNVISAEDVFIEQFIRTHEEVRQQDPMKYREQLEALRDKLERFTSERVHQAEKIFQKVDFLSSSLPFGKFIGRIPREMRGKTGVTDHANLTTAIGWFGRFGGQERAAKKAIREGKLKSGDITIE